MDLTYYNFVTKALAENKRLKSYNWPITVFRYFQDAWYQDSTELAKDHEKIPVLTKAKSAKGELRNGRLQYKYIDSLDSVIEIEPTPHTRKSKRDDFTESLNEALINAEHHFNANHDTLTRLPNRNGFESTLKKITARTAGYSEPDDADTPYTQEFISVITLDIDHFKQINDSYLHEYGDIVLKAFSWRVSEYVKHLDRKYNVKSALARVGGEEFDIAIVGFKEKNIIKEIAEQLRKNIEEEEIPSDKQLESIKRDHKLTEKTFPNKQQRRVTASIGFSVDIFNPSQNSVETYHKLKTRADTALYRAKANGRNCAVDYDEIRRFHGKVIDHFDDTEIISIDVGSNEGVKVGAVYSVYTPNFSGDVSIYLDDGRSKKTIGTYPKICSGQISVIEAQEKISFCRIISKSTETRFAKGSKIEYVPMGIIRPLPSAPVPSPIPTLMPFHDFSTALANSVSKGAWQTVYCFRFLRHKGIGRKKPKSSVAVSERHAWCEVLSHLIRICLPTSAIGYVRDDLIMAFHEEVTADANRNETIATRIAKTSSIGGNVFCGVVERNAAQATSLQTAIDGLTRDDLIYCARLTAFVASSRKEEQPVHYLGFSENVAAEAVYMLRSQGLNEDAQIDYHKLARIGINSTLFINQLSLILMNSDDLRKVQIAELTLSQIFEREVDENIPGYVLRNMGYIKTILGDYRAASDFFAKTKNVSIENGRYGLAHFKALLELEKEAGQPDADRRQLLIELASKHNKARPTIKMESDWLKELRAFSKKTPLQ